MLSSAANAVWISGGVLHVQPGILALAPCISGDWHCSLNTPRTMSGRRLREAVKSVSCWGFPPSRLELLFSGASWFFPPLPPAGLTGPVSHRCFLLPFSSDRFSICFLTGRRNEYPPQNTNWSGFKPLSQFHRDPGTTDASRSLALGWRGPAP